MFRSIRVLKASSLQEISFAYSILSDPPTRRLYDMCGVQGIQFCDIVDRMDSAWLRGIKVSNE